MDCKREYILVTGGAGYIGSHIVKLLFNNSCHVIVLDNLINGHEKAVVDGVVFIKGDFGDKELLTNIFSKYNIASVFHIAAFAYVGESVNNPSKYYQNNVSSSLNLLDVMMGFDCKKIVLSSTCATYGNPIYIPIDEFHPQIPINPYGQSKLMLENIIMDYYQAYGLKYVFLRYFNACGASEDISIGEDHNPETHLIPIIFQVVQKKRKFITIFGDDYDTPDGTCIRDYIHVNDIAQAHFDANIFLNGNKGVLACNLGTGNGYSVKELTTVD